MSFGARSGRRPGPGVYNRRSMQPVTVQEQVDYASLGWRFTAVLIDTVVLLGLWIIVLMVYIVVLAGQGRIDPNDPAAAQQLSQEIGGSGVLNIVILGSLFIYYVVLEAIFAASVGKLVCRMRVVMADGSRATGLAVVVRNVIRVPEAIFFYIPSGISCAVSPRRQRLGDHAARTVVIRRRMLVTAPGMPGPAPGAPLAVAARRRPARPRSAHRSRRRPSRRLRRRSRRGRPRSPPLLPARRRSPTRCCASRRRPSPPAARTSTTCASPSASSRPAPTTRRGPTPRST